MNIQIEEQVLPERYQQWITSEINRILRDIEKEEESDSEKQRNQDSTQQAVWRRENDIRSELEKSKLELASLVDKVIDQEKKCEYLKQQAIIAEEKEKQALIELEKAAASVAARLQAHNSEDSVFSDESESSCCEDHHSQDILHMNKVATKGMNACACYCIIQAG